MTAMTLVPPVPRLLLDLTLNLDRIAPYMTPAMRSKRWFS